MVALVKDAGAGGEGAGHGNVGEALQLSLLEVGEERHAAQQLHRALPNLPHIAHKSIIPGIEAEHSVRLGRKVVIVETDPRNH
jgi:hypothetical protein